MASTTIINRINDLIGDNWDADMYSELETVCSAFNEVIDLCPHKLLRKYADNSTHLSSGGTAFNTEGYKIIEVFRRDVSGRARLAKEIPFEVGLNLSITNSIYQMDTDQDMFPVWYIDSGSGAIAIKPGLFAGTSSTDPGNGLVFWFKYFTPDDDPTSILAHTYSTIIETGYPTEAVQAGCLKAALNIMNAKVSQATQDEEDAELMAILQGQQAALTATYTSEIKRIQEMAE